MARTFTPGQTVWVLSYRQRANQRNGWHSSESWEKREVVKQFRRRNNTIHSSSRYDEDPTGNYVLAKRPDFVRNCFNCKGEGEYLPQGFLETASYRKFCEHCNGTGKVTEPGFRDYYLNTRSHILYEEEYEEIVLLPKRLQQERQQSAALAKSQRIKHLIPELVREIKSAAACDEDPEVAAANFLIRKNLDEITAACSFIIEQHRQAIQEVTNAV